MNLSIFDICLLILEYINILVFILNYKYFFTRSIIKYENIYLIKKFAWAAVQKKILCLIKNSANNYTNHSKKYRYITSFTMSNHKILLQPIRKHTHVHIHMYICVYIHMYTDSQI